MNWLLLYRKTSKLWAVLLQHLFHSHYILLAFLVFLNICYLLVSALNHNVIIFIVFTAETQSRHQNCIQLRGNDDSVNSQPSPRSCTHRQQWPCRDFGLADSNYKMPQLITHSPFPEMLKRWGGGGCASQNKWKSVIRRVGYYEPKEASAF